MALQDFKLFTYGVNDLLIEKVHDLDDDTFKFAIIDSTITPTRADATPAWSAASGPDFDANEVATVAGIYPAGGVTVQNLSVTVAGAVNTFTFDPISLAKDAGGWTDGRWGILYNDSATDKNALGYYDFGSVVSLVAGDVELTPASTGVFAFEFETP